MRRFIALVLLGVVAASALAVLSYARVNFNHGRPIFTYRQDVTYGSNEILLVTQQGFPEGRSVLPLTPTGNGTTPSFADPSRFSSLAAFYAYFANSDAVVASAARHLGRTPGKFIASPVLFDSNGNASVEPLLQIQGLGTSPTLAKQYAQAGSAAFRRYLGTQQVLAGIPPSQRVLVTTLNQAGKPFVLVPRKKTIPIVVFMAVLAATLALVLVLDNVRPRIKVVERSGHQHEPIQHESIETRSSTA
jgi:hypothetical protein